LGEVFSVIEETGELFLKKYCTTPGMEAAKDEYERLRKTVSRTEAPACGRNSVRESERQEHDTVLEQLAVTHGRMKMLAEFIHDHTPFSQQHVLQARVGNLVRIEYEDAAGGTKTKAFVLGGENEPAVFRDQDIEILSYLATFGKAFVGMEVGDTAKVQLDGVRVEAEITAIELLPQVSLKKSQLRAA